MISVGAAVISGRASVISVEAAVTSGRDAVIFDQAAVITGKASRTLGSDALSSIRDAVRHEPAACPDILSSMIEDIDARLEVEASIPRIHGAGS